MELEDRENVFSVSEVTAHLKNIVENYMPIVYVEGEISNFTRHSSGHLYFSLKDENATMRCVFFRNYQHQMNFFPQDGDKVICLGKVSIYEKGGQYQLNVQNMIQSEKGDLQRQFELLKEKLSAKGLFDPAHKKDIPSYPERIGVVTSPTGAAFQDIRNILSRRYPCEVYLYPATVQGESAAKDIIAGICYFNEILPMDVLIIGRGGGSQEDLFCFNDEQLAYAIYDSKIPVISAVGHEIDFTISDFVADLRAPTPSAAAELAVPDKQEALLHVYQLGRQLKVQGSHAMNKFKIHVQDRDKELQKYHPRYMWQRIQQRFDEAVIRIQNIKGIILGKRNDLTHNSQNLQIAMQRNIEAVVRPHHIRMNEMSLKLKHNAGNFLANERNKVEHMNSMLSELSPYEALKRGYALVNLQRKLLQSVNQVAVNDNISVKLKDGSLGCEVKTIEVEK
ncbi:MAG TPA: exodeoxyribonuclease VII large subunit [Candidatus Cloacimonadota bacterium]|nr:exodeoxyribonuclease VII large subunit [Candidatus Cloacimonadota bacterium]HPT71481.1 exodeoxyribonuclease VII large subunit [Candidatus Cloacimonadota bacterium]